MRNAYKLETDPVYALAVTRKNRYIYKESKWQLRERVRDMALKNFTMWVKRDQIAKLQRMRHGEERRLEALEQRLEKDAAMFDQFLKDNDRSSVEAIKEAEMELKKKQELAGQVKFIQSKIHAVRAQVAGLEEQLSEMRGYAKFLQRVIPIMWKPTIAEKKRQVADALEKHEATKQKMADEGNPKYLRHQAAKEEKLQNLHSEISDLMDQAIMPLNKEKNHAEDGGEVRQQAFGRNALSNVDYEIMEKMEQIVDLTTSVDDKVGFFF